MSPNIQIYLSINKTGLSDTGGRQIGFRMSLIELIGAKTIRDGGAYSPVPWHLINIMVHDKSTIT